RRGCLAGRFVQRAGQGRGRRLGFGRTQDFARTAQHFAQRGGFGLGRTASLLAGGGIGRRRRGRRRGGRTASRGAACCRTALWTATCRAARRGRRCRGFGFCCGRLGLDRGGLRRGFSSGIDFGLHSRLRRGRLGLALGDGLGFSGRRGFGRSFCRLGRRFGLGLRLGLGRGGRSRLGGRFLVLCRRRGRGRRGGFGRWLHCGGRGDGRLDGRGRSLGHSRRRLGTRLFEGELGRIALDEHALLADFDLNGTRTAGGIGLADFGGLASRQGDLLALGRAMGAAQRVEQLRLVAVGNRVVYRVEVNASRTQLLQQHVGRHFQLGSELGDSITRH